MEHFPWIVRTGLGQDSHSFEEEPSNKPCIIGGIVFENTPGFNANSDGDIVLHAICNSISSLTNVLMLGPRADYLCSVEGIKDSSIYLKEILESLGNQIITFVSLSLEGGRPKILKKRDAIRQNVADLLNISPNQVGLTATTGETLTNFGMKKGMQCISLVTTMERIV